jgi:hypothetical protein
MHPRTIVAPHQFFVVAQHAAPDLGNQTIRRVIPRAVYARGICFFFSPVTTYANHN